MTLPTLTGVNLPWEEISQDEIELQVEPINGNKLQEMNVHIRLCAGSRREHTGANKTLTFPVRPAFADQNVALCYK